MLAAARAAGVVHMLGTEFRWDPGQATLARAIRSGAIGEPRLATIVLHVPVLADPAPRCPAWWADADAGGGWFGAHGSQVIDQLRVTLGELAGVSATLTRLGASAMTADDAFVMHFETRAGCAGVMQSTAADWGPPIVITRVAGTAGTGVDRGDRRDGQRRRSRRHANRPGRLRSSDRPARTAAAGRAPHRVRPHDRPRARPRPLHVSGRGVPRSDSRDAGRGPALVDDPKPATFEDGVAGMAVLDAARHSAPRHGAWVGIDG